MHARMNYPTGTPCQSGHEWWRITWSGAMVVGRGQHVNLNFPNHFVVAQMTLTGDATWRCRL
jgi:hypothetical protein